MTFPELTSFENEMLQRTNYTQRDVAVLPNQYRTARYRHGLGIPDALLPPHVPTHSSVPFFMAPQGPVQVSLALSNTKIPKNVLLLLFKNNHK